MKSLLLLLLALATPLAAGEPVQQSPIAAHVERAEARLAELLSVPSGERSFDNTARALDALAAELEAAAWPTVLLASVGTTEEERAQGRLAEAELEAWLGELERDPRLHAALSGYAAGAPELTRLDQRLVRHLLSRLERNGVGLPEEERAELQQIETELQQVEQAYRRNIAEDRTLIALSLDELRGVPESFVETLPREGELVLCAMTGGVVVRLITYAELSSTRLKAVIGYGRRAMEPNLELLDRMLVLRSRRAELLGFPTSAALYLADTMAGSPERVMAFYDQLLPALRPKAEADFAEYQAAKREHTGDPEAVLQGWDLNFYANQLRQSRYAFDSRELEPYLQAGAVTRGALEVASRLYGLHFEEATADELAGPAPWAPEVRLFKATDAKSGELVGGIYLDLHPRPGKFTGNAKFPLRLHRVDADGSRDLPLVALVCNLTGPGSETAPALFSHAEVVTLFHELGHCLHSLLNRSPHGAFSGTRVAGDFVEAPSQMFERWAFEPEVLATFARHHETGEPMPARLLDGLVASRNLGSGMGASGQAFLGLMDLTFHSAPGGELDTTAVRRELYRRVRLFEPLDSTYGHAAFSHLVGYDSAYYGYLWSEVYAADMFEHFRSLGLLSPEAGQRFRELVLAPGATRDELQLVRDFLGREPSPRAFVRQLGLVE